MRQKTSASYGMLLHSQQTVVKLLRKVLKEVFERFHAIFIHYNGHKNSKPKRLNNDAITKQNIKILTIKIIQICILSLSLKL